MATSWQVIDPHSLSVKRTFGYLASARAYATQLADESGRRVQIAKSNSTRGSKWVSPSKRTAKPVVKNISEGFYAGGVFHPIRHSADYRPEALSGSEGDRARSGRRGGAKRAKAKKVAKKKTARKAVKKTVKKAVRKNPMPTKVPVGKFLTARLNKNGTVSFVVPIKKKAKKRS